MRKRSTVAIRSYTNSESELSSQEVGDGVGLFKAPINGITLEQRETDSNN
jgi:hypothetical protein